MSRNQCAFVGVWCIATVMVAFSLWSGLSLLGGLWVLIFGATVAYLASLLFYVRRIALSCPEVNEFRDQPKGQ